MNLPHPRRPSRLVAAALAALSLTAQANGSTLRLAPGLHVFDTPQVFGPDDVLELVLAGGLGCDPCHTQLMFQNTVHFDGTLKLTLDDSFIPWGGHWIWLFLYRGIPDVPGTALPSGRFHTLDLPASGPRQGWSTDSLYTNGTVLLAQLVPEPASVALWGAGLALLGGVVRRRAKSATAG